LRYTYNYIILLNIFSIKNIHTRKYTRKKSGLKKISWDILGQSTANKAGGIGEQAISYYSIFPRFSLRCTE
jgi:hypothetical protein